MKPRVLVSDELSTTAVDIFNDRGIDVDYQPEMGSDPDALLRCIDRYDGLAIRSATKATKELIDKAGALRVIGRAGIGVDNVDIVAATRRGIIVMNTPFGNSETTAEHAIGMMFALARQIPAAHQSILDGKWEKSRFMGSELLGKTLGVIGCGNIGAAVCRRANGLGMTVIGFDPYLNEDRATRIGIEKVTFEDLLERSDIVTLHVPMTESTRNMIDAAALARMKTSARLINCARGGLVDEEALREALTDGKLAGAALDVFAVEPPVGNPLLTLPQVITTPHLGASTTEAQENVALQVAMQMSDYLLSGAVSNAINMPSISAEDARRMQPWVKLANYLGSFVGQMTNEPIRELNVLYDGTVAELNTGALNAVVIAGLLKVANPEVNMVSAEDVARERGIIVSATTQSKSGIFDAYMKLSIRTGTRERSIVGTVFSDGRPRFIQIKGIYIEADVTEHMLYTTNEDTPGVIGRLGTILGEEGVNIANFNLGRSDAGSAIALLSVDAPISDAVLTRLRQSGSFNQVMPLRFGIED
ncbi:MAG: phosphoglycerate dehydrogenase [Rhodobacteraceae bacterium]|nr:phosphoglycerate dehydrogenase [Paracoccaceae bacterium]